jgi:hypothetical protein
MGLGTAAELQYYLQADAQSPWGGHEETFAEIVGIVLGGGGAPDLQEAIIEAFDQAFAFVRDLITGAESI